MVILIGILLSTYVAAVAETALAPVLAVYQIAPSLLAIVAVAWVVSAAASPWSVAQVASIGLVFDLNVGGHVGVGLASYALLAFAAQRVRPTMRRLGPIEQAFLCAPLMVALLMLIAVGNALFGHAVAPLPVLLLRASAAGVYSAAMSLPVWMILDWVRDAHRFRDTHNAL